MAAKSHGSMKQTILKHHTMKMAGNRDSWYQKIHAYLLSRKVPGVRRLQSTPAPTTNSDSEDSDPVGEEEDMDPNVDQSIIPREVSPLPVETLETPPTAINPNPKRAMEDVELHAHRDNFQLWPCV